MAAKGDITIGSALALPPNFTNGHEQSPLIAYWQAYHKAFNRPIPAVITGDKVGLCEKSQYPFIFLIETDVQRWGAFAQWANNQAYDQVSKFGSVHLYGDAVYYSFGGKRFLAIITPKALETKKAWEWCRHYWQHNLPSLQQQGNPYTPPKRILPKFPHRNPNTEFAKRIGIPFSYAE